MGASKDDSKVSFSQFACIGSGFSAIGLGATLQRWYGITDVRFFERHSDLGGTWFINKYPGCAVDIPSILYSFSFEPNPAWTKVLPTHDELWKYLKSVADKYDLPKRMTFGATVERCEWIEESQRWRMFVRQAESGELLIHECKFLFGASGGLVFPRDPDMPGAETFKGPLFHAARWRSDVDIRGKKVVVIGNGCTATQIVASVAGEAKQLTQFARSKHWIIPPLDLPNSENVRLLFKYVPGVLATVRFFAFIVAEWEMRAFYMTDAAASFRARRQAKAERYMRRVAPKKYHDMLIPDFALGCKRRIFDCGYMDSLHRDDVELTSDAVLEIVPEGVRTKNGIVEADVIVLANGYKTNQYMTGVEVVGKGETATEHWESFGGAEAYNSVSMNGFPNFFMILGPNTATGHTSTILASENAINYSLRLLKPILDGNATTVEVKREAEERFSEQMQADLRKTVWFSGCSSWYVKDEPGQKKWNAMSYPHSQPYFWYQCLFPEWKDFTYSYTPNAWRRMFLSRLMKVMMWESLFVSVGGMALAARRHGTDVQSYLPYIKGMVQSLREKLSI